MRRTLIENERIRGYGGFVVAECPRCDDAANPRCDMHVYALSNVLLQTLVREPMRMPCSRCNTDVYVHVYALRQCTASNTCVSINVCVGVCVCVCVCPSVWTELTHHIRCACPLMTHYSRAHTTCLRSMVVTHRMTALKGGHTPHACAQWWFAYNPI